MKKNITFYCDSMDKGGTEKATLELVNNLPAEKYNITLVQLTPGGHYQKELRDDIKIKEILPISPKKSLKWYWRLRRLYQKIPARINHRLFIGNKQDVEVACGYGYPNIIVSKAKKAKKVLWVHMDVSLDRNKVAKMSYDEGKKYFENIDVIVCVSKECAKKFNDKFGFHEKTKVIYNILDKEKIIMSSNEKPDVSFDNEYFNIISAARLTWQKGFDHLIDEIKSVLEVKPKTRLYIAGQGEDYEKLKKQIDNYGLNNKVFLLGYVTNPYPLIKQADLYVCSSRHESFGLTVAESMILNTPVLSTRCTGPNEILEKDYYGKLVNRKSGCLAAGIINLMNNTSELDKYVQRGKDRIEIFDVEPIINSWEDIFDRKTCKKIEMTSKLKK